MSKLEGVNKFNLCKQVYLFIKVALKYILFLPLILFVKNIFSLLFSNKQMLFDESEIAQSDKNKEVQQRRYVYQSFYSIVLGVIQMGPYVKHCYIIREEQVQFKKFHFIQFSRRLLGFLDRMLRFHYDVK